MIARAAIAGDWVEAREGLEAVNSPLLKAHKMQAAVIRWLALWLRLWLDQNPPEIVAF